MLASGAASKPATSMEPLAARSRRYSSASGTAGVAQSVAVSAATDQSVRAVSRKIGISSAISAAV